MSRTRGYTIVQIMVLLLLLGIVLWASVNALIGWRCRDDPAAALCKDRAAAKKQ